MSSIRRATIQDAASLSVMLHETWHRNFDVSLGPETVSDICNRIYAPANLEKQAQSPDFVMLVAEDDHGLAGHAMGQSVADHIKIHRLYVHPDRQARGLGTGLFQRLVSELPECDEIRLDVIKDNPKALAFYYKQGFRITGEMDECLGSGNIPSLNMIKKVA